MRNEVSMTARGLAVAGAVVCGGYALTVVNNTFDVTMIYSIALSLAFSGYFLDRLFKKYNYEKLFRNCGLENKDKEIPIVIKCTKKENKTTLVIHLPPGLSQKHFESKQQELEQALNSKIEFGFNENLILEMVQNNLRSEYDFELRETDNPLEVYFGESDYGPYYLNIEKCQHIIIGGATDSGKSSGITDIVLSLILNRHNVELHLHDFQDITLGIFADCKKVRSYGTTPEQFSQLLDQMEKECENRLKLFRSVKNKIHIEKLSTWNKEFPNKALPYKLVVVDEFGRLSDKEYEYVLEKFRTRVQMDRKAGIHYLIVLHRCSVDMLSGSIKTNMPTRISFRTATATDSKVILDEDGAEKLKQQGRCLIMNYDGLKEVQALYIEPKNIRKLLKKHNKYKTREEIQLEKRQEEIAAEAKRKSYLAEWRKNNKNPY